MKKPNTLLIESNLMRRKVEYPDAGPIFEILFTKV